MMRLGNALREGIRYCLYRQAKVRVLVLGDSHVRVFEYWRLLWDFPRTRFDVVYVPGGSASGIRNRASQTGAFRIFSEALAASSHDLVLVNLGEVDTAYTLWRRAEQSGKPVAELLIATVNHYCVFLDEVSRQSPVAVLSACLPTLADHADGGDEVARVRSAVAASQQARTALTLEFNARVAAFCARRQIPYLNCASTALGEDGVVRPQWVNQRRYDHHYARFAYARWLTAALRQMKHPAGITLL